MSLERDLLDMMSPEELFMAADHFAYSSIALAVCNETRSEEAFDRFVQLNAFMKRKFPLQFQEYTKNLLKAGK